MNQRQSWLSGLLGMWRQLERDEGMGQTPRQRATIVITGLYGAGKSTLYNSLQGFEVSPVSHEADSEGMMDGQEDLGLFLRGGEGARERGGEGAKRQWQWQRLPSP